MGARKRQHVVSRRRFLTLAALAGSSLLMPEIRANAQSPDLGSAVVSPSEVLVRKWLAVNLTYSAGAEGIAVGGALRVQFPKSFDTARIPQVDDPTAAYFVSATSSNPQVSLALSVAHADIYDDVIGGEDNFYTTTISVQGAALASGETINYIFGDQSQGGRGVSSSETVALEPVRVAVDTDGSGIFQVLSEDPMIATLGRAASSLRAYAPSFVAAGEPFSVTVVALDEYDNNSASYRGQVAFSCTDPAAILPAPESYVPADEGSHVFAVTFNSPGSHLLTASDGVMSAVSNPIVVSAESPAYHLYWGDTHVHSDHSPEAYGNPESELGYARRVTVLDFVTILDHSYNSEAPLTPREWVRTKELVTQHYQPGVFVPVLGYEWSSGEPLAGHRTVLYPVGDAPLVGAKDFPTILSLWSALAANGIPALTLPHHLAIGGELLSTETSFEHADPRFQRVLEIYQTKGQSESYDPSHPLSYENCTNWFSVPGPYYAQDAWMASQRLGVIASSDEHKGKPGRRSFGLAAVYAQQLTRDGIFDALRARHSYATTGERIVLEFYGDGHMMGDEFTVELPYMPTLDVRAVGTDVIDWIELLKYDGVSFSVVHRVMPGARETSFTWQDEGFTTSSIYYVRLHQLNQVDGRDVMAWSSPIWIDTTSPPPALSLFESYSSGDSDSRRVYGATNLAQSFTPSVSHTLQQVRLKLAAKGLPGTVTVRLRPADAAGLPTGADLALGQLDGNSVSDNPLGAWYAINLPPTPVTAGLAYAITVEAPGGDSSNNLLWRADSLDATYAGGTASSARNANGRWKAISGSDMMFEEWGSS